MAQGCTVDAELFDSLQEAIAFVAAHGGGVVYSEAAASTFAQNLTLPDNVRLEQHRPSSGQCGRGHPRAGSAPPPA